MKEHRYASKNSDLPLYRSIRKYGLKQFSFEIIEKCDSYELLLEREKFWINLYDSYNAGYNLTQGGDLREFKQESIDKMRKATYSLPPYSCDKFYKGVYLDCGTYCYRAEINKKIHSKGGYRTKLEAAWERDQFLSNNLPPEFEPYLHFPDGKTIELIREQLATKELINFVKYTHGNLYRDNHGKFIFSYRDVGRDKTFRKQFKTIESANNFIERFIEENKSIKIDKKYSLSTIQKSWEESYGSIYQLLE